VGLASLAFLDLGGNAWAQKAPVPQAVVETVDPIRTALQSAIRKVYPALVRIHVVAGYFSDGREVKGESAGSGVIISNEGYVITNHHVAGKARRIQCTLSNKRELEATLVGTDPLVDIAVIKLDLAGGHDRPIAVAEFGDSETLRVGDQVLAMGCPRAISQSVTLGIVSNTEMTFPSLLWPAAFRMDGEDTGSLVKWIGHDAQIFPGNSGGPLVNLKGEIVGINEISFGLGGAIPGNLAREVADQIIQHGGVRRSWLGIGLQPLLKGDPNARGVLVSGVAPGSPAEAAGLRAGDVLLSYDGRPLNIHHPEELTAFNRVLLGTPVGARVGLSYRREGKDFQTTATTLERGSVQGDEVELKAWGITLSDLTLLSAKELKREPQSGVLVTSLRPGAPAAEAKPPLQPEDVIVKFGGKTVRTLGELVKMSADAGAGKSSPTPMLVGFERGTERLLTVVKLGERETPDRSAEATKAWVPVASQVLTADLAEALGLKGKTGIRLTQVYGGTTAEVAGLRVGDILLRLEGESINASQPHDIEVFPSMVRQYRVGRRVKLEGVRDGSPLTVEIELAPSPKSTRELPEYRDPQFDFSARDLTFQDVLREELDPGQSGALITRVESGGWGALAHMAVDDIVLAVDGAKIATASDLEVRMKRIAKDKPSRVVFFVRRGVRTLFLELEPAWTAS